VRLKSEESRCDADRHQRDSLMNAGESPTAQPCASASGRLSSVDDLKRLPFDGLHNAAHLAAQEPLA
jgi:hypothetical protein